MNIELFYNNDTMKLTLPDNVELESFSPRQVERPLAFDDFKSTYEKAGGEVFFNTDSLLIVVNDSHRSTPTAIVLKWFKQLQPDLFERTDFVLACGTHQPPSDDDLAKLFGELYDSIKDRIHFHDCHNYEQMTAIGMDKFQQSVFINNLAFNYDKVFAINSVEPHYFAGFTGGRKSFIPGLADFATIERNHNLANSLDCAPMKLAGNPMAEHLDEIISIFDEPRIFSLQIVYDAHKNIAGLFFGRIKEAFHEAVKQAEEIYSFTVAKPFDLTLLEILPPLDKNMYQAQKALENNQAAIKDNGTAVIVSACYDGIGSEHFFKLAQNWDGDNNCPKDGIKHFGSHKLSRVNAIGKRIDAKLYSSVGDDDVRQVFYQPAGDINKLLESKLNKNGNHRVAVIHDAAHTVLKLINN